MSLIIEHPWIFYWIGFIIVYLIIRRWQRIEETVKWNDFFIRLFLSCFSWLTLMVICILYLFEKYPNLLEKFPKEPPKWL